MFSPHTPKQNHLLAALPAADYARLLPDLELIPMPLGWAIQESGCHLRYAYFPTTSIASLRYITESGASAELATTGNDGLVGISVFMGGGSTTSWWAVCQSAGYGYRLRASVLKREFALGRQFQRLVLCYTQALITQMAQTTTCNRHHSIDQQLCRWLLVSLGRLECDELLITQRSIASMLGVRRESVALAASNLQKAGLIHYSRGHIKILNRRKLEERVCECYSMMNKEYERLQQIYGEPNTTTPPLLSKRSPLTNSGQVSTSSDSVNYVHRSS